MVPPAAEYTLSYLLSHNSSLLPLSHHAGNAGSFGARPGVGVSVLTSSPPGIDAVAGLCYSVFADSVSDILPHPPRPPPCPVRLRAACQKERPVMSKPLVAYFSASGVTERAARELARAVDADLYEIRPAQPYTAADLDWRDEKSRSTLEMQDSACRPEISGPPVDLTRYDTIFLGFPIWWYVEPRIVDTFLEGHDFTGKTLIPVKAHFDTISFSLYFLIFPSRRGSNQELPFK